MFHQRPPYFPSIAVFIFSLRAVKFAVEEALLLPALAKAKEKAKRINHIEGDPNALGILNERHNTFCQLAHTKVG